MQQRQAGVLNRPRAPSDYQVLSPSSDPSADTWDQSLANRDIYTLGKVGRC